MVVSIMEKKSWESLQMTDTEFINIQLELGKKIKIARIKKNVTVLELANISGVGDSNISKLENGRLKSPGLKNYLKICYALNMNPADFFADIPDMPPFNSPDYEFIS